MPSNNKLKPPPAAATTPARAHAPSASLSSSSAAAAEDSWRNFLPHEAPDRRPELIEAFQKAYKEEINYPDWAVFRIDTKSAALVSNVRRNRNFRDIDLKTAELALRILEPDIFPGSPQEGQELPDMDGAWKDFLPNEEPDRRLELATAFQEAHEDKRNNPLWGSSDFQGKSDALFWSNVSSKCNFSGIDLKAAAKSALRILEPDLPGSAEKGQARVADLEYYIEDSGMIYQRDLHCFAERVNGLFGWHNKHEGKVKPALAPYFPMVQSSGMGKTKLLYELHKWISNHPNDNYAADESKDSKKTKNKKMTRKGSKRRHPEPPNQDMTNSQGRLNISADYCRLILCSNAAIEESNVFTNILNITGAQTTAYRDSILAQLNAMINKDKEEKVVLLFDEAQHLLQNDGWAFRCVRWWLREVRKCKVVAVFTGTTSKLANFYGDIPRSTNTRGSDLDSYHNTNGELYPPFYQICTVGLQHTLNKTLNITTSDEARSEYDVAVPYGRQLFARLQAGGNLDAKREEAIMGRIMLSEDVDESLGACFSILGTRAQMGQVGFSVASDVIAKGYSCLTYFSVERRDVADVCFFPDPVCARLAMGLMVEDHQFQGMKPDKKLKGRSPSYWMGKAGEIFTHGICRPHKGDIGEVACALYMLFCGDVLRHKVDRNLTTFSVDLDDWLKLMRDPNEKSPNSGSGGTVNDATISFIQVCRNYLRHSLADLQGLLPDWYNAGRAAYAYDCCKAYDIIAPVRQTTIDGKFTYAPLLISIKNRLSFSPGEQTAAVESMKLEIKDANIDVGYCVLILVGLQSKSTSCQSEDDSTVWEEEDSIKCAVVKVPNNDRFGVSKFVHGASIGGGEIAEVYVSHPEAALPTKLEAKDLVRKSGKKTTKEAFEFLKSLQDAYKRTAEDSQKNADGRASLQGPAASRRSKRHKNG